MIKKSIRATFLLVLGLLLSSCSHKAVNDWEANGLKGKVRSVTENMYEAIQRTNKVEKGLPYRPEGFDFEMKFNEQGYITEQIQFGTGKEPVGKSIYKYDKEHPTLKTMLISYDQNGEVVDQTTYRYTADHPDEVQQYVQVDADGNTTSSQIVEYNKSGDVRTTYHYSGGGRLLERVEEVIEKGYPIETRIYDVKDEQTGYNVVQYRHQLMDSMQAYDPKTKALQMAIGFKYDDEDNLTEQHGKDGNGEAFLTERYEYEYDKEGNWTRRVHYVGSHPAELTERFIEYYK